MANAAITATEIAETEALELKLADEDLVTVLLAAMFRAETELTGEEDSESRDDDSSDEPSDESEDDEPDDDDPEDVSTDDGIWTDSEAESATLLATTTGGISGFKMEKRWL